VSRRLTIRTHGLAIGLRADPPVLLARLVERLPPGWRPSRARRLRRAYTLAARRRGASTLHAGSVRIAAVPRRAAVLDAFERDLQHYVAEWAPERVFVHAGVVGWRGAAIVVPGRSMSGKTTLVAALLRAGATYYSDEYAVLDLRGRVHPFARPLALRDPAGRRRRRGPAALGAATGARPLPVGLVVVSRYRAGARWRPRRLSPAVGALALMANTVSARRQPARALAAIQAVVLGASVLQGTRGEASAMARALLAALGRPGV
jgi:hypothetical protein